MSDVRPTILLVGESPPRGAPVDFRPFDCQSGTRLAKFLGLVDRATLLDHVPMTNIFHTPCGVTGTPPWDTQAARGQGAAIMLKNDGHDGRPSTLVALGRKVVEALPVGTLEPMTWRHSDDHRSTHVIAVPHPSGQHQLLNTDNARAELRRALLPDLFAAVNVTLRPWHLRLDEPRVLADAALALCPLDPPLAAAVLVMLKEIHEAKAAPNGVDLRVYRESSDQPLHLLGDVVRQGAGHMSNTIRPASITPLAYARELKAKYKFAARTLPKPAPADVRATHGRLVALGVA